MATLLLRLAAPLQSWGADSKFEIRKTDREPTKSGVVGLLAAALGLRRDEADALQELGQLRFAVRVDREGSLLVDFHTAGNPTPAEVEKARAARKAPLPPYVTKRQYLSDAIFLAGLESADRALLERLEQALRRPAFPLFLGRRSCPPTMPLCLGIREEKLLDALRSEPPQAADGARTSCRIVIDADPGQPGAVPKRDLPLSFSPIHRQYGYRAVEERAVGLRPAGAAEALEETEHDPFTELR
ncbi:MAG TPA: type I-E CRISPR-associated protein Cas5/CasD [Candidatus Flavonifractor avistercoris]|nr:type I-E CRISPR-associated protein Cas5/CasD [Candidatus Flavonifractor avistercoris]